MQAYYRNKLSGEIKLVEQDSAEMFALQQEQGPDGHSKWEQTSFAHSGDVLDKAAHGELDETDLGKEDQEELRHAAVALDLKGIAPESNPHLALTPGEIEAGLTPAQKLEDLKDQYDTDALSRRAEVLEGAADRIADERVDPAEGSQTRGQRARAGGSDEREGAPVAKAPEEGSEAGTGGEKVAAGPSGRNAPAAPPAAHTPPSQPGGGQE